MGPRKKLVYLQVWAGLLFSVGVYFYITTIGEPTGSGEAGPVFVNILTLVASLQVLGALVYRYRYIWVPKSESNSSSNEKSKPGKLFTKFVVVWAFCESAAVYGMVLFFLGYESGTYLGFFIASAISLLICFPFEVFKEKSPEKAL